MPKDHIKTFTEVPFTSEQAEFNVLQAGGKNPLDVGYLPTVNAPVPPPGSEVGQNPVAGYTMKPVYTWGLNYMPYNFSSTDPQLAVVKQLYMRQVLQYLLNQSAIVQGALHGYGQVTTGPVGPAPVTKYLSPQMRKGDPFPFNVQHAHQLLTDHGWTVHEGGVTVCTRPGAARSQCGEGVKAGTKLNLTMLYASGNAWVEAAMLQLKSNAANVGIQIALSQKSFDGVLGVIESTCNAPSCQWELGNWGEGWSYVPDYLPTGDELFGTGSAGNLGHYSDIKNDRLIAKIPAYLQPAVAPVGHVHVGRLSDRSVAGDVPAGRACRLGGDHQQLEDRAAEPDAGDHSGILALRAVTGARPDGRHR